MAEPKRQPAAQARLEDEAPSLAEVPRQPSQSKLLVTVILSLAALAAFALAAALWHDAAFALESTSAQELGELTGAALKPGFVRARVSYLGGSAPNGGTFRRPFDTADYVVAPVKVGEGQPPTAVVYRIPEGQAGPRFVPPRIVQGRAERASELGWRYRGVGPLLGSASGGWVLIDAETPRSERWLLAVEALLVSLGLGAAIGLWRVHRRVS